MFQNLRRLRQLFARGPLHRLRVDPKHRIFLRAHPFILQRRFRGGSGTLGDGRTAFNRAVSAVPITIAMGKTALSQNGVASLMSRARGLSGEGAESIVSGAGE